MYLSGELKMTFHWHLHNLLQGRRQRPVVGSQTLVIIGQWQQLDGMYVITAHFGPLESATRFYIDRKCTPDLQQASHNLPKVPKKRMYRGYFTRRQISSQTTPPIINLTPILEQNWVDVWPFHPKTNTCMSTHAENTNKDSMVVHQRGTWVLWEEPKTDFLSNLASFYQPNP